MSFNIILVICIAIYIGLLSPKLSKSMKKLFTNTIFRIFIIFSFIIICPINHSLSIIIAVAFILTLDYIYVIDAKDTYNAIEYNHGK